MPRHTLPLALVLVVLSSTACSDDDEQGSRGTQSAEGTPERAQKPRQNASDGSRERKPSPSPSIAPEQLRTLVTRWVAAQNEGDFDAYRALYAERFEGIKRAGPRLHRFGRDGWLADRRKMFRKPMRVRTEDVRVRATRHSGVITFVQHWASPSYRDVGPKQLVVVERDGELRIAREEMLSSRIVDRGDDDGPDGERFRFVLWVPSPHVVVHTAPDDDWAKGPPELLSDGSPVLVRRDVAPDALSETLGGWKARTVRLVGPQGPTCTGTLGEPSVIRRVEPHFGTRAHWRGELGERAASRSEIAASAWDLAEGSELLVAPLRTVEGDCDGARWAHAAGQQPRGAIWARSEPEAELKKRALHRFRALPAYRSIQRDLASRADANAAPWDGHGGAAPEVWLWRSDEERRQYVSVSVHAGSGCGDFEGALWALFERRGDALVPRTDPTEAGYARPLSLFDLDGDGFAEVLARESFIYEDATLLRLGKRVLRPVLGIAPRFLDCSC